MKKMKWIALVALALAAVMALSSCALFAPKGDVAKLFDKDREFESDATVLAAAAKVDVLADLAYQTSRGDLAYFTDRVEVDGDYQTKHVIYNLATGAVIFDKTESRTSDISVALEKKYFDNENKTHSYAVVTTTTRKLDENNQPIGGETVRTALYDALGNMVDDAIGEVEVESIADLLYFDGKCYRFAEDGKLAAAFDFAALGKMPELVDYNEDYYMAIEDARIVIYDKSLAFVSAFDVPAYADMHAGCLLPNGKVLLQYEYELDENAKKYDYIRETTTEVDGAADYTIDRLGKFDMVTLLINAKNGKAKEIKCDYVLGMVIGTQHTDVTEFIAIDFDKVAALGMGYKIEDKRVSNEVDCLLTVSKKGKLSPITYEGARVTGVKMVASERYVIETEERDYLVDKKGKLIGEVTNGEVVGDFILCEGKVFDLDLAQIYDLNEKDYTVSKTMETALLLENAEGDTLLYTGKGEPAVIAKDGEATLYSAETTYAIVLADGKYTVYAQNGNALITIEADGALIKVAATEDAVLFATTENGADGIDTVYYRVSK